MSRIAFEDLGGADLVLDAVYCSEGDARSSVGGEPLHRLLGVGTQGGFRKRVKKGKTTGLVLTTSGNESEWPDYFDYSRGEFVYYGDNRSPGRELHDTKNGGNRNLRDMFSLAKGSAPDRSQIPLILAFQGTGEARNFVFRGLLVPGEESLVKESNLIALWRQKNGERFQNYRATFTMLDVPLIDGDWARSVFSGEIAISSPDPRRPAALEKWIATGSGTALVSERFEVRSKEEQKPKNALEKQILETVYAFCKPNPFFFEKVATEIWKLQSPNPTSMEITRRHKDGGRDAIGKIFVGHESDPIGLSFALEAKLYNPNNSVGVRETSRLISRIRHREFGILVTTGSVDKQAYSEVRSDGHPIIILSSRDVAQILIRAGIQSEKDCLSWLESIRD